MLLRDQILACAVRVVEARNRIAAAEAEVVEAKAEYDRLLREAGLTGEAPIHTNGATPPQPQRRKARSAPKKGDLQSRTLALVKASTGPISTDALSEALQCERKKVGWALRALQSKRKEIKRVGKGLWVPA
jgi:biotin operon repressor